MRCDTHGKECDVCRDQEQRWQRSEERWRVFIAGVVFLCLNIVAFWVAVFVVSWVKSGT